MASSVHLSIVDSRDGAVLVHRWLGGNAVVERVREVVGQRPDAAPATGDESWAVQAAQLVLLESSFYAGAPTAEEIEQWASRYGQEQFWWFLERNF